MEEKSGSGSGSNCGNVSCGLEECPLAKRRFQVVNINLLINAKNYILWGFNNTQHERSFCSIFLSLKTIGSLCSCDLYFTFSYKMFQERAFDPAQKYDIKVVLRDMDLSHVDGYCMELGFDKCRALQIRSVRK